MTALATVLDHVRLLGRKAYPQDLKTGDLILVKHITQDKLPRLQGLFGQVRTEVERVNKKTVRVVHYMGDERLGEEDQIVFYENERHQTLLSSQVNRLLAQLEKRDSLELLANHKPKRFFTGEVVIFHDQVQGYVRFEDYKAGQMTEDLLQSSFVRVVSDVAPITAREQAKLLLNT